jgi:hypothetical protein
LTRCVALKWFPGDGSEPIAYEGGRDLDAFTAYITKQIGVKSSIKPPPPPATTILDAQTFDSIALDSSKNVLVSFTAPWCGHCKTMKPHYEKGKPFPLGIEAAALTYRTVQSPRRSCPSRTASSPTSTPTLLRTSRLRRSTV